nr:hypothetical protein [Tanacetum cinerariifolium]
MRELVDLVRELVILIDTEAPLFKAASTMEKKSTHDTVPAPAQGELQPVNTSNDLENTDAQPVDAQGEQFSRQDTQNP